MILDVFSHWKWGENFKNKNCQIHIYGFHCETNIYKKGWLKILLYLHFNFFKKIDSKIKIH
jgi:hypothetical protein